MLILNPEHLERTQAPLRADAPRPSRFAPVVRVVLAAGASAAAFLAGYGITQYFADAWPVWYAFGAFVAFVCLASLTAIAVDGYRWQVPLAVIWGAAFSLALPWRDPAEAFAMTVLVTLSAIAAYAGYMKGVASYATLHTFTVARRYASGLTTGIVLALIVLYGAAISRGTPLLPQGALAGVADQTTRIVPTFLPTLQHAGTSSISVTDLARASVTAQLQDDPRFQALSEKEQRAVLEAAVQQAAASFSKQLGLASSSPDASIGNVAQSAAMGFLDRFRDQFGWYFLIAWLLGAFFVARSAAFLLTFAAAGLVWLTTLAALALGILRIDSVPTYSERLIL